MSSSSATVEAFKSAVGLFASGVTVITVYDADHRPWGMTATAFCSVSIDPLTVLVCINRATRTHALVESSGRLGINILDDRSHELSNFCAKSGDDKYLTSDWLREGPWESPAAQGAIAFLDCSVDQAVDGGTHTVFLCRVRSIEINDEIGAPLVYWRGGYRELAGVSA